MKRFSVVGMGALALIGMVLFCDELPVSIWNSGVAVAQNTQAQGQMRLRLDVEKKVVERLQGKQKVSWQSLQEKALVQPGDVLRYTIHAVNHGNKNIQNLTIKQAVPKGMVYILDSATINVSSGAKITYSIDGGRSFVDHPTVKVTLPNGKVETKPAPATVYTHIRWKFATSVAQGTTQGSYQVQVR